MYDQLVGYVLGALAEEESELVERLLQADEKARQQADLLRRSLLPLQGDTGQVEAPPGLARRTCRQIRTQGAAPEV